MTGQKINHNIEELCLMAHETQKIGLLHVIPDLTNSMDNFYDFCFERDSFPSFQDKCNYMNNSKNSIFAILKLLRMNFSNCSWTRLTLLQTD